MPMTRKIVALVVALAALTSWIGVLLAEQVAVPWPNRAHPARVVSLTPAITDTLFAIDAGPEVVGISDFCDPPSDARNLPRVGTGFSPNYERIAGLEPTLIVGEPLGGLRPEIGALAETRSLPWFSLKDVVHGTQELGRLTGHVAEAERLIARLTTQLAAPNPPRGPRVLLVLGTGFGSPSEFWFARPSSLHGRALEAAGGTHAVPEELPGPPNLSLEQVVLLDPDVVLVLSEKSDRRWAEPMLSALAGALRAKVALIAGPNVLSSGPKILELVESMRRELVIGS